MPRGVTVRAVVVFERLVIPFADGSGVVLI